MPRLSILTAFHWRHPSPSPKQNDCFPLLSWLLYLVHLSLCSIQQPSVQAGARFWATCYVITCALSLPLNSEPFESRGAVVTISIFSAWYTGDPQHNLCFPFIRQSHGILQALGPRSRGVRAVTGVCHPGPPWPPVSSSVLDSSPTSSPSSGPDVRILAFLSFTEGYHKMHLVAPEGSFHPHWQGNDFLLCDSSALFTVYLYFENQRHWGAVLKLINALTSMWTCPYYPASGWHGCGLQVVIMETGPEGEQGAGAVGPSVGGNSIPWSMNPCAPPTLSSPRRQLRAAYTLL